MNSTYDIKIIIIVILISVPKNLESAPPLVLSQLRRCSTLHQGWKNSVFWYTRKSTLLKASSGESCASRNFVLRVTLGGTRIRLMVYLALYQMKQIMER